MTVRLIFYRVKNNRRVSQAGRLFLRLGIMLSTHVTKTIKSRTQWNNCDKVSNGQHRPILLSKISQMRDDLCNRSYKLSAQSEPPFTSMWSSTPGIKPEHMITNMLRKINIKSNTYKAKSKFYCSDMYAGWKEQSDSAVWEINAKIIAVNSTIFLIYATNCRRRLFYWPSLFCVK